MCVGRHGAVACWGEERTLVRAHAALRCCIRTRAGAHGCAPGHADARWCMPAPPHIASRPI
eukprot:15342802-Alexandrium_andersonii.AAC.1